MPRLLCINKSIHNEIVSFKLRPVSFEIVRQVSSAVLVQDDVLVLWGRHARRQRAAAGDSGVGG